jgi:hypothetical protein
MHRGKPMKKPDEVELLEDDEPQGIPTSLFQYGSKTKHKNVSERPIDIEKDWEEFGYN